ncbi:hypothetical protein VNO77_23981 [Canavalia gladiata]|uniref:Secreted protein n=1 Tax=Canavalia gladiata TaxID=3824 RepID=A0AAN9L6N6_CANGL
MTASLCSLFCNHLLVYVTVKWYGCNSAMCCVIHCVVKLIRNYRINKPQNDSPPSSLFTWYSWTLAIQSGHFSSLDKTKAKLTTDL